MPGKDPDQTNKITNGIVEDTAHNPGVDGAEKNITNSASEPSDPNSDGDLLLSDPLRCKNCQKMVRNFRTDGAVYLCYYCTELNLCEECFEKKLAVERGDQQPEWRATCATGHQYVKAPVDGWGGLAAGVMTIGGEKIAFKDWLNELKTKKWKEAWEQYWT